LFFKGRTPQAKGKLPLTNQQMDFSSGCNYLDLLNKQLMKKLMAYLLLLSPLFAATQNVAINTDGSLAHNAAILDIKSDSKGLLIPRMTTLQRNAIAGPAIGLIVFDTDTYSFWMYRGDINGAWAELQHNYQNLWTKSGNNITNTNTGNVTIGPASNFDAELKLNGISPRLAFMNNDVAKGFIRALVDNLKIGTYPGNSGNIIFSPKNVDKVWITENGQMGIGTSNPSSDLTINGSNPYIQIRNNEVNTGFVQAVGSHLKLGTNSTNLTGNLFLQTKLVDRMMIDENGLVGIGTNTPSSILTINSNNPILQLRNNNVDKGFVQLVNDDIRIGTNSSNNTGKFIVRTNGVDRFTVHQDGTAELGDAASGGTLILDGPVNPGLLLQHQGLTQGYVSATSEGIEIYRSTFGNIRIHANGDGMWFFPNGQIAMGQGPKATGYLLSIEGKAIATEFKVLAVASWPDYVFAKNYKLLSLKELKAFIGQHKHLPNIPAAAEIEKEGIALGDMTKKLMEKVEELTLYILQLQDQLDELKKQLDAPKDR
jgi:hypothetical protein